MKVNFGSDLFNKFGSNVAPTTQSVAPVPTAAQAPVKDTFETSGTKPSKGKIMDYITKYSGIAAMAALPITVVVMGKLNTKEIKKLLLDNKTISETLSNLQKSITSNDQTIKTIEKKSSGAWTAIAAFAGGLGLAEFVNKEGDEHTTESYHAEIAKKATEKVQDLENRTNEAKNVAYEAKNTAEYAKTINQKGALHSKYLENVHGFQLLKGVDKKAGYNQGKYDAAVTQIKTAADSLIHGKLQADKAPLKAGDTVWSITSEFAPIKEGGLGSVPVELQNNFEALGIKTPTFVPMYQKNGFASLKNENEEYKYNYSGTEFNVEKIAEFKVHAYKHHDSKDTPVEVFVSRSKVVNGKEIKTPPLVFIKNDEYFNGSIYSTTAKSEESEKFAFFAKATYEFAKAKLDPNSVKGLHITNRAKYDEIAPPNGLMLNDWQAAPIAALSRYKAPMENAYGGLNDKAAKTLSDMRIMTIGHNAQYQGATNLGNDEAQKVEVGENILNTLFDNFASDIVKNAETNSPYDDLKNSLILNPNNGDKQVNLLNMGVCLSDYFAPVSKNYAKELVEDNSKSEALQWGFAERSKSNTLVGIINGNDLQNIALEKIKDSKIKSATNVDFKTYNQNSSEEEILSARLENKKMFLNQFIRPFTKKELPEKLIARLENVGTTNMPELTDEEIAQTPIFSYVHRLVDQKGVEIVTEAIKKTYDNWDKDFPGKPRPIFYLAGEDGEGGAKRALIENLKKELKPEDSNRVLFAHGFTPIHGFMAATDYFLMPSKFEPCGLTQSEAFAQGTPVIATATGGIVDTVVSEGEGQTGILTKEINGEGFYKAIKEGANAFINDKPKHNNMVINSVKQDFSWIQPNRQGPIYEYLDYFGIDRNTLPEKSEIAA